MIMLGESFCLIIVLLMVLTLGYDVYTFLYRRNKYMGIFMQVSFTVLSQNSLKIRLHEECLGLLK